MTTQIPLKQHKMLEQLTGLQHTRTGQVRKYQNRSAEQSSIWDLPIKFIRLEDIPRKKFK